MTGNQQNNGAQYTSLNNVTADKENYERGDNLCGCGPCKPTILQRLARPVLFTGHVGLLIAVNLSAQTYFNGILTTIERQFKLSSSEAAALTIINDASMLCLILFVTHFGQKSHRPRWIASGAILVAVGIFVCSLPHFLSDPVDPQSLIAGGTGGGRRRQKTGVCNLDGNATSAGQNATTLAHCQKDSSDVGPVKWIVLGQIIWGCGAAPLFPLALSYIDDAVQKQTFISYTAFLFISITIGPMIGFFITSTTTSLYVDFDRVPSDAIPDLHQYDPRWIGAWWLAFPFFSLFLILVALPMFFYPKKMKRMLSEGDKDNGKPGVGQQDEDDLNELATTKGSKIQEATGGIVHMVKGLLLTIKRLLCNAPLMLMCFGAAAETGIGASSATFNVKYLQTQFKTSPATAAILMGGLTIPCVTIAQIVSAAISRRFKFDCKQCIGFVLICHSIGFVCMVAQVFIGCGNFPVAGVNTPYQTNYTATSPDLVTTTPRSQTTGLFQPLDTCNIDCHCPDETFRPVCGRDNISYISPCHAGCIQFHFNDSIKEYSNCGCISSFNDPVEQKAVPGLCYGSCNYSRQLAIYIAVTMIAVFTVALTFSPKVFVIFRLVDAENRSVALGMKSVVTKCFAFFPVPILAGMAINSTCILWQYTCGNRGSCWLYDIVSYRYLFQGMQVLLKIISLVCFVSLYLCFRPSKAKKTLQQNEMTAMGATHND